MHRSILLRYRPAEELLKVGVFAIPPLLVVFGLWLLFLAKEENGLLHRLLLLLGGTLAGMFGAIAVGVALFTLLWFVAGGPSRRRKVTALGVSVLVTTVALVFCREFSLRVWQFVAMNPLALGSLLFGVLSGALVVIALAISWYRFCKAEDANQHGDMKQFSTGPLRQ